VRFRDLYFRWKWAQENGWTREKDGEIIKLKRVRETTLSGRYKSALNTFGSFAIGHWFAYSPAPDFESHSKYNPPAAERDAFEAAEKRCAVECFRSPAIHEGRLSSTALDLLIRSTGRWFQ
jgi:hypothetical protein